MVIVLLLIAVLVMAGVVALPYLRQAGDGTAMAMDREQESAASQAARLYWADKLGSFIGIFDPETKTILEVGTEGDTEKRHYQIAPYGKAQEHLGEVIVISCGEDGLEDGLFWTEPGSVTDLIEDIRKKKGLGAPKS